MPPQGKWAKVSILEDIMDTEKTEQATNGTDQSDKPITEQMTDLVASAAGTLAETAVKTVAKKATKAVAKRVPKSVKKAARK